MEKNMDEAVPFSGIHTIARVRPVLAIEMMAIEGKKRALHLAASSSEVVEHICLSQNCSSGDFEVKHDNESVEKFGGLGTYKSESILESIRAAVDRAETFCLMAYGQTGSGKTYTCMEILPHISNMLLNYSACIKVELSAFELHLETVVDLLASDGEDGESRPCSVRQDSLGRTHVDAKKTMIRTQEDAESLIKTAFAKRASSATESNKHSSRSHAFVRYTVRKREEEGEDNEIEVTIVDLAGNERYEDAFHHDAARLSEMKAINGSLGCLKDCLRAVLQNKKVVSGYVPYRRSKLTTILKDSLDPALRGCALLVAHLAPVRSSLKHSVNTLRLVTQITERHSLAEREKRSFSGPEAWSADQMVAFVRTLREGRYASLASSFRITGKLFSVEWVGHVERRVVAAGGTEKDAEAIYNAFHEQLGEHKRREGAKERVEKPGSRSAAAAMRARAKAAFARKFSHDDVVVLEKRKEL